MDTKEKRERTELFGKQIGKEKFLNPEKSTIEVRSEIIGNILKFLRNTAGLTQSEVANKIGIAQQTYAGYESGRHQPNVEILIRLADVYDMPLDYISGRYVGVEGVDKWEMGDRAYERLQSMQEYYAMQRESERIFLRTLNK